MSGVFRGINEILVGVLRGMVRRDILGDDSNFSGRDERSHYTCRVMINYYYYAQDFPSRVGCCVCPRR